MVLMKIIDGINVIYSIAGTTILIVLSIAILAGFCVGFVDLTGDMIKTVKEDK